MYVHVTQCPATTGIDVREMTTSLQPTLTLIYVGVHSRIGTGNYSHLHTVIVVVSRCSWLEQFSMGCQK